MTGENTERDIEDKLIGLWEALGRPEPPDIPPEALISEGISQQDYEQWRLDLEDEKRHELEIRADAALVDARDSELRAQGMEPLPPRRTPEEVAAIERRQLKAEERARLAGEAEWLPEEDEDS